MKIRFIAIILSLLICSFSLLGCENEKNTSSTVLLKTDESSIQKDESVSSVESTDIEDFLSEENEDYSFDFESFSPTKEIINTDDLYSFQFMDINLGFLTYVGDFMKEFTDKCSIEYTTTYNPDALVLKKHEFQISLRYDAFDDFVYTVHCLGAGDELIPLSECAVIGFSPEKISNSEPNQYILPNGVDMREMLLIYPGGIKVGDSHEKFKEYWSKQEKVDSFTIHDCTDEINVGYRKFTYFMEMNDFHFDYRCDFDGDTGVIMSIKTSFN